MRPRPGIVVLALALPVGLFAMDPGGLYPYSTTKSVAVWVVVLVGAALTLGGRRVSIAVGPAAAWLAFLAFVIVAATFGMDGLYAWTGTPERHFGVLTWLLCALAFLAGQALDDAGDSRFVAAVAVVSTAVLGLWAAAEAFGWRPVAVAETAGRLAGPLGSPAFLGAAAALLVPTALGCALDTSWSRRPRLGAAASTVLGTVALIGSGARAAWFGVALAAAVVAWAHRRWMAAHAHAVVLAGVLVAVAVAGTAATLGTASRLTGALQGNGPGGTSRLAEWRVAVRVIAAHPVTGVGPEGYRIAFAEGVDAGYERRYGRAVLPDRAHNGVLDVAVTTGLPGVAAYAALVVLVGRRVVRAIRREPVWRAGLAAGLLAYAGQQLFLFPLASLEPAVWLLAGLVVAGGGPAGRGGERSLAVPRLAGAGLAAVAAALLVLGGRDAVADRRARSALNAIGSGLLSTAGRQADAAVSLRPDVLRYRLVAARASAAAGGIQGLDAALTHVDAALRVSPRDPVVRGERGRLLLARAEATGTAADRTAARRYLGRLVGDDPLNAEWQLRFGVAAALAGDHPQAERAWRSAEFLAPHSAAAPTNLAVAYAAEGRWPEARAAAERALQREPATERARAIVDEARQHGT